MYESLLEWCKFTVTIHAFNGLNKAGDATYTSSTAKCYIVDELRRITDKTGKEYFSYTQLFFPPETVIKETDMIEIPGTSGKREIYKKGIFFDGNIGAASIIVVYI